VCSFQSGKGGTSLHRPPLRTVRATLTAHGSSNSPLKVRCLWLLTVLLTSCQSMALRSVVLRPSAPFAKLFGLASNFHLEVGFLHNALRATHQDRVGTLSGKACALSGGLWIPLAFRLIRHSLLDPSFSRWGFRPSSRKAYCRRSVLRQTPSGFTRSA
jgi:hypothetical protein